MEFVLSLKTVITMVIASGIIALILWHWAKPKLPRVFSSLLGGSIVTDESGAGETEAVMRQPSFSSAAGFQPKTRRRTPQSIMGHESFREIITRYGGSANRVRENAKILSEDGSQILNFDTLFDDGTHRIAVDYHDIKHSIFPNPFHRSLEEFENQKARDSAKAKAAKDAGFYLITVPYTVDRCRETQQGWTHEGGISVEERKERISTYLRNELVRYYQSFISQNVSTA